MTKQNSTVNVITIALFSAILLGFLVAFFILPDKTFSSKENRYLAEAPKLSFQSVTSGDFMDDTEEYLADQFPARDEWCVLQAASNKAIGRRDNNGVYLCNNSLVQIFWTPDEKQLHQNLTAVKQYASSVTAAGGTVYFAPVANAVELEKDSLPALAPDASEAAIVQSMEAALASSGCTVIDTLPSLQQETGTDLYYRTDHHMTTYGAFRLYSALAPQMHLTALNKGDFDRKVVSTSFTGTLYNKSAAWWVTPDSMEQWSAKAGRGADQISLSIPALNLKTDSLYDTDALKTASQYDYFCYGNQPLEVIKTDVKKGGKLLVIKDSYAHALIPFLANHYSEIHMIDLRYYHGSISAYADENHLDTTLILYNISNFCEDTYVVGINT